MVTATELNYKNFGRCVKLDNGTASIIITVEVGPRHYFLLPERSRKHAA